MMLLSIIVCVVLVGIATALWIASYIQITQTIFSSPEAYTRTLFQSCTVTVTPDMGAKIHVACCVLSALTWGIMGINLYTIWAAYREDQDRKTQPQPQQGGVINDGPSTEEEGGGWQPVMTSGGETAVT
jgi:hypothetical protein